MTNQKLKDKIMYKSIINYRLSMDSVCELFKISKDDLIKKVDTINNAVTSNAIRYVLYCETIYDSKEIQESAKKKTKFLFLKINVIKDKEKLNQLFDELDSKNTLRLKNKNPEDLTEEEINKILNYKYKFALTVHDLCSIFDNLTKSFINYHTDKLKDKTLLEKLKKVSEYNEETNNYHRRK